MIRTVEEALAKEHENIDFDPQKLSIFLYGQDYYQVMKTQLNKRPVFPFDMNMFNRGRVQILKDTVKMMHLPYNNSQDYMSNDIDALYLILNCLNQIPGSIHTSMFMRCINIMGDESQIQQFIDKSKKYDIVGCYAQTEIAHGSDVSSLGTNATFSKQTDQFIIDTPDIKAVKFWPGDLGLFSTHALVFANLIIDEKKHGIHAFVVPIRDPKTMEPLQGVQVGDIGPKIGFPAKDNGYLILHQVRIPRKFMLSKFTKVKKNGEIKSKGDPKIGYATMMEIRKHICLTYPKIYTTAITIATRYSIFRRQFKNKANQEIRVIDYQLQQDKIISRIAQYYAITISGNRINQLCTRNLKNVLDHSDFSLMAQTHICLSLGKPFMSQIVYDGMQICRKACGGHGFSMYSGFPFLINQYSANLTYEGQNTVLYLQVARFMLKNYKNSMNPDKKLPQSVKYLREYNDLIGKKCSVQEANSWNLQDLRVLFAQGVYYLLSVVTDKMLNKDQSVTARQVWNKHAGIKLKQLAVAHSVYYVFNNYKEAIQNEKDPKIKQIVTKLCLLFGVNMVLTYSSAIVENGQISVQQMSTLRVLKQNLLRQLRPIIIGLVDGFGIPDKFIRSALVRGNPYENMLNLARQNDLNKQRLESVEVVKGIKKQIRNPDPKM